MLDRLPREVLMNLFVDWLPAPDAYFARFWCRHSRHIASRALELIFRQMIDGMDLDLCSAIKGIRDLSGLQNDWIVGRLLRRLGGTLNNVVIIQFVRENYASNETARGPNKMPISQFLKGFAPQPTVAQIRYLLDFGVVSTYSNEAALIFKETGYNTRICVEAALRCTKLCVSQRLTMVASLENWSRTEICPKRLARVFKYIKEDSISRDHETLYLCQTLMRIFDQASEMYRSCLLHPEGWEARGKLLITVLLNHRAWSCEFMADALAEVLISDDITTVVSVPQTVEERRTFIRGCVAAGRVYWGNNDATSIKTILGAFMGRQYWPKSRDLQAWHCLPPEFVNVETVHALILSRRNGYPRVPTIDFERFADLIHQLCDNPGGLLLEVLRREGTIVKSKPVSKFICLLSQYDNFTVASLVYAMISTHPKVCVVPRDRFTIERFCELLVICLVDQNFGVDDSFPKRFEKVGLIAQGWISSLNTSEDEFDVPEAPDEVVESLWKAINTVEKVRPLKATKIRTLGLLCGASLPEGPLFSSEQLSEILARNDFELASMIFSSYDDVGEFHVGYALAVREFPELSLDKSLFLDWVFLLPKCLRDVDVYDVLSGKKRRKMLEMFACEGEEVIKMGLILGL